MGHSRQKAIREMCRQCVAADKKNFWVKEVESCQGYSCPLYHQRPVRNDKGQMIDVHRLPVAISKMRPDNAQRLGVTPPLPCDQRLESHKTEKRMQPTGVEL